MAIEHKNPTGSHRDITPDMLIQFMGGEGNVSMDNIANDFCDVLNGIWEDAALEIREYIFQFEESA
ncbi:MAG: hypothetical protein CMP84_01840 [Gammaproteobacteria bacterium]|jgi:hypothetical protein|nr:hypothetical protein [Gammaproteobacteria bacterium]